MNYSEPLYNQLAVFFHSLGGGIIIGVLYDLCSVMRIFVGTKKGIYIAFDLLFCFSASVYSFFFMVVYNSGEIRFNMLISQLAGALLFHFALGKYFCALAQKISSVLRKTFKVMLSPFFSAFKRVVNALLKAEDKVKKKLLFKRKTSRKERDKKKSGKKLHNILKFPCKKNKNPYTVK